MSAGDSYEPWIYNLPCQVRAGTESLQTWLNAVAERIGGSVVPRGDLVLIVARSKGKPKPAELPATP